MAEKDQVTEVGVPEHAVQMVDSSKEPATPRVVLSIHAHPDDQEFTVGGTLAKWAKQGSRIITVCITSGDSGSNQYTPADMTPELLAPIREREQKSACDILGVQEVVFLRYPDGMLTSTIELRRVPMQGAAAALPPILPAPLMVKLLLVELFVMIDGDTVTPEAIVIPFTTPGVSSNNTLSPE